ncbi:fungal-specific transcription factor domain-containing protein [Hyaloraphidium curvatum]|nr:fungal-specific transcription factor domain-containing protein [Hyaloraphidium curvatum]
MQAALAAGNGARAAARGRQPARKPGRLATAAAAGSRHAAPPGTISPGVANPLLFARIDSGTPSNAGSDRRRQASASAAGFSYAEESDDAASDSQDRDDGYGSGSESGSDDGGYADGDEPAVHANGGVLYPDGGLQLHSPRAQPAATALAQVAAHHAPRQSFSDSVSVHSAGSEVGSSAREPPYGENEVIMPLITLFFSHVYPLMPIIHRSSFLENLIPTNQHPPLLLNAIYTMSARFSNDPLIYTDPRRPYAAGDPFFNRAKKLLQNAMDEPSVPTVQALLLLALGAAGSGKGSLGWMYTGTSFAGASPPSTDH